MWQKKWIQVNIVAIRCQWNSYENSTQKNSNVSDPFQSVDISLWAVHIATDESVTESQALNENGRFFIGVFHLIIGFVPNTAH